MKKQMKFETALGHGLWVQKELIDEKPSSKNLVRLSLEKKWYDLELWNTIPNTDVVHIILLWKA